MTAAMRLQVFLSSAGVCSRRRALLLVQSGRVSVNGKKVVEPSYAVSFGDRITVDGKGISSREKIYVLLNKPRGAVTTREDRFAEKKVMDLLPQGLRHLYPVGRLDKDTTGLLFLTNDGPLAFYLAHPSFGVEKTYRGFLDRPLEERSRLRLQRGLELDGRMTAACRIRMVSAKEFEITLHEGRKRQIRRMFEALRYRVVALERVRQGPLELGGLEPGAWRYLTPQEVCALRAVASQRLSALKRAV